MIKRWIVNLLLHILYPKYLSKSDGNKAYLLRLGFFQKIIGINRKVSWPVHFTSVVKEPQNVKLVNTRPGSAMGCYLDARNGIELEENVLIGPHVSVISMNHDTNNYEAYKTDKPIILRKNCWLGANSIILPGTELGEHTIVAAGAVVTKSFPEGNQVLGGNPAKVIKQLEAYKGAN